MHRGLSGNRGADGVHNNTMAEERPESAASRESTESDYERRNLCGQISEVTKLNEELEVRVNTLEAAVVTKQDTISAIIRQNESLIKQNESLIRQNESLLDECRTLRMRVDSRFTQISASVFTLIVCIMVLIAIMMSYYI